jgi:Zn-dependent protease with chaperone function
VVSDIANEPSKNMTPWLALTNLYPESFVYYSHPPLIERIEYLQSMENKKCPEQ